MFKPAGNVAKVISLYISSEKKNIFTRFSSKSKNIWWATNTHCQEFVSIKNIKKGKEKS